MIKIKYIIISSFVFVFFLAGILMAEDTAGSGECNVSYKVMFVSLIIWIALSIYIYYINRKVKDLEKKLNEK